MSLSRACHLAVVLALGAPLWSAPISQLARPQGLTNGDTFRLIFLGGFAVNFNSSNVADYDDFITDQAALDHSVNPLLAPNEVSLITQNQLLTIFGASGVTWKAIVSTSTVDARDHIGTSNVPIFRMDGQKVANNTADLWDGNLIRSVRYDQPGHEHNYPVWTGSLTDGTKSTNPLGHPSGLVTYGTSDSDNFAWINAALTAALAPNGSGPNGYACCFIYGISSEITLTPEPASMMLTGLGSAAVLWAVRRRRRA